MYSIADIIRRNAETYYDIGTTGRTSRARAFTIITIASVGLGAVVNEASADFLAGALSAEAILVGFSFNVLFYLVANRLTKPVCFSSIEHELRFERLSKLSDEAFDNVTYFNVIAIASAVMALILLLAGSSDFYSNMNRFGAYLIEQHDVNSSMITWTKYLIKSAGLAALIFLLCESISTFLRTVERVRFYFSMLKTMNDGIQP